MILIMRKYLDRDVIKYLISLWTSSMRTPKPKHAVVSAAEVEVGRLVGRPLFVQFQTSLAREIAFSLPLVHSTVL